MSYIVKQSPLAHINAAIKAFQGVIIDTLKTFTNTTIVHCQPFASK